MEDTITYLKRLGLSGCQARALAALLTARDLTAREISKLAEIKIQKVYEILQRLLDKELITFVPGKPRLYRAMGLKYITRTMLTRKQRVIDELSYEMEKQVDAIEGLLDLKETELLQAGKEALG